MPQRSSLVLQLQQFLPRFQVDNVLEPQRPRRMGLLPRIAAVEPSKSWVGPDQLLLLEPFVQFLKIVGIDADVHALHGLDSSVCKVFILGVDQVHARTDR